MKYNTLRSPSNNNMLNINNSGTSRSNQSSPNAANLNNQEQSVNHLISDAEFLEIERVMQRASMIEQKEMDRIG